MTIPTGLGAYPLCSYFLSGYLLRNADPTNFPPNQSNLLERYEDIFSSAIQILGHPKEALKRKSEFNFDSGNAANLESGIAVLRVVKALTLRGFTNVALIKPKKNMPGADLICERNSQKICCEVKALTKQSTGRRDRFMEDQLYEKILETISRARTQLATTAAEMRCTVTLYACVINWFDQSIYLGEADYQQIVNRLEKDQEQSSLKGVDAVFFVTKMGQTFLFLNDSRMMHELLGIPREGSRSSFRH